MRILVTGATGFIGSYVTEALLRKGHTVVGLVRNPAKIPAWKNHPQIQWVQAELDQVERFGAALEGCEVCIHIALGWGDDPVSMLRRDTLPAVALLQAAAEAGCSQFIYTSSTAAMGLMRPLMNEETHCLPVDLYGATKAAVESFVLGYHKTNMRRNIIRPGYTFGNPVVEGAFAQPDQRFMEIARRAWRHETIELIRHDGTQFAWAGDLARLYVALAEGDLNEQIFLGLSEEWVSWERIARETRELCGSRSEIRLRDLGWEAEPMRFSVEKMRRQLGISYGAYPELEKHIRWCVEQARREMA